MAHRDEILSASVHQAWRAVALSLGESPTDWETIEPWRRAALEHTIGFWESWNTYRDLDYPTFLAATQVTWMQYHRRNHWQHSALVPYAQLSTDQQRKLRAMLDTYILFRSLLDGRM